MTVVCKRVSVPLTVLCFFIIFSYDHHSIIAVKLPQKTILSRIYNGTKSTFQIKTIPKELDNLQVRIKKYETFNEERYSQYKKEKDKNKTADTNDANPKSRSKEVSPTIPSVTIDGNGERAGGWSRNITHDCLLEGFVDMHGAKFWINGQLVWTQHTETQTGPIFSKYRGGVGALVLHQNNPRKVYQAQFYDTSTTGADTMLVGMLDSVSQGRIVVLLGAPNFVSWLRDSQATKLQEMLNCQCDFELTTGESWALVAYKKAEAVKKYINESNNINDPEKHRSAVNNAPASNILYEGYVTSRMYGESLQPSSPQHFSVTITPKSNEIQCPDSVDPVVRQRAHFCSNFEGYAEFCDCIHPLDTNFINKDTKPPRFVMPVVLVGGGRRLPQVLRQVVSIRSNRYGSQTPLLLSLDGWTEEAKLFAELLNLPVIFNRGNRGEPGKYRINEHVAFSLNASVQVFPEADKVIVLEDDLRLAPDFISYFQEVGILMKYDNSVLFVNAYRYNAYPHTASNTSTILRAAGYPYYGWMVRREDALHLLENWAPLNENADWDIFIKSKLMGRRCVILPEVPRTKHEGGMGVHVSGVSQEQDYSRRPLNTDPAALVALGRTWQLAYNLDLIVAIEKSHKVNISQHPCVVSPVPKHSNESFVIYISSEGDTDETKSFLVMATCMDIFELGIGEHYEYTFRLRYYETNYYIVGCPVSPFCLVGPEWWYTPSQDHIVQANTIKWKTRNNVRESGRIGYRIPPTSPDDPVVEEFERENIIINHIGYFLHLNDTDTKHDEVTNVPGQ